MQPSAKTNNAKASKVTIEVFDQPELALNSLLEAKMK